MYVALLAMSISKSNLLTVDLAALELDVTI